MKLVPDCTVTNFDLTADGPQLAVRGIQCLRHGIAETIAVGVEDLVIFQNGSMTDASSYGSMASAPAALKKQDRGGWTPWEQFAAGRPESYWESFPVTLRDLRFFDQMETFARNSAGTGGLVTFQDSRCLMSIVPAHQPHLAGQPEGVQVFWVYALHPDRTGDFVAKLMSDCNGADILQEVCGHLNFDRATIDTATCIPCRMPYITSTFMPRELKDRPLPVPKGFPEPGFCESVREDSRRRGIHGRVFCTRGPDVGLRVTPCDDRGPTDSPT